METEKDSDIAASCSDCEDEEDAMSEAFEFLFCPICDNVFNPPIYQCPLGHCVCKKCWDGWIKTSAQTTRTPPSCPTCRTVITSNSLVRNLQFEYVIEELKKNNFTEKTLFASRALLTVLRRQRSQLQLDLLGQIDIDPPVNEAADAEPQQRDDGDALRDDLNNDINHHHPALGVSCDIFSKRNTLRLAAALLLIVVVALRLPILGPGLYQHFFVDSLSTSESLESTSPLTGAPSTELRHSKFDSIEDEHRAPGEDAVFVQILAPPNDKHASQPFETPRAKKHPYLYTPTNKHRTGNSGPARLNRHSTNVDSSVATYHIGVVQHVRSTLTTNDDSVSTRHTYPRQVAIITPLTTFVPDMPEDNAPRSRHPYENDEVLRLIMRNEESNVHLPPKLLAQELGYLAAECVFVIVQPIWELVALMADTCLWALAHTLYYTLHVVHRLIVVAMVALKSAVYVLYLLVDAAYQSREVWGSALIGSVGVLLNLAAGGLNWLVGIVNYMIEIAMPLRAV